MLGRNAPITLDHWLEGAQKDRGLGLKAKYNLKVLWLEAATSYLCSLQLTAEFFLEGRSEQRVSTSIPI